MKGVKVVERDAVGAGLRIGLPGGQRIDLPWPGVLSRGCALYQGPAGLLPAGDLRP